MTMTCHTAANPVSTRKWAVMGRLMKRVEAAKSPKAKSLEKKMIRKAKDPQTKAKISKHFRKFAKKRS
jgi:hypothetical protein